ncbi:hypothetical protein LTR36_010852, partial [Oleoguttula mirabilis]
LGRAVDVDLGGAGLAIKPRNAEPAPNSEDEEIDGDSLGSAGDLVDEVVDSLPVDASVDVPVVPRTVEEAKIRYTRVA